MYRRVLTVMSLACVGVFVAPALLSAQTYHANGFETDTGFFNNFVGGVLNRVASGTDGVTSASGNYHGQLIVSDAGYGSGAYTFHTNSPPQIAISPIATFFSQSIDIFLDVDAPGAEAGDQFIIENSIEDAAQNWTEGSQFNVVKTATGWSVAGNAIDTDGWYTFVSIWSDTGVGWDRTGALYDSSNNEIFSSTSPADQISYADAQYVGYTWVLNDTSLDSGFTLAIDNAVLTMAAIPEPSFTMLLAIAGLVGICRRRKA